MRLRALHAVGALSLRVFFQGTQVAEVAAESPSKIRFLSNYTQRLLDLVVASGYFSPLVASSAAQSTFPETDCPSWLFHPEPTTGDVYTSGTLDCGQGRSKHLEGVHVPSRLSTDLEISSVSPRKSVEDALCGGSFKRFIVPLWRRRHSLYFWLCV